MKKIVYKGISVNNIQKIDFELSINALNCIIGPSGSGKSSLAFNAISKISEDEYNRLIGNEVLESIYSYDYISQLLVSIPLEQINKNQNPRSTIATYYGVDKFFSLIFAYLNNVSPTIFSFNKFQSSCKTCKGLGYIYQIDKDKILEYNTIIEDIPFLNWKKSSSDFYKRLLKEVGDDHRIPITNTLNQLNEEQFNFLLYGSTQKKYKISYTQNKRKRKKTSIFLGAIIEAELKLKKDATQLKEYTRKIFCTECKGTRFSKHISTYKVLNIDIGNIYLLEMDSLLEWLNQLKFKYPQEVLIQNNANSIITFIDNIKKVNLGYLNFNRSISSLSGGEFQRLRLSQLFSSSLHNLLYILDEPLNSLHPLEIKNIQEHIFTLKARNTVVIVEHNLDFIKSCDRIITLGEGSGKNGGAIVSSKKYLDSLILDYDYKFILGSNDLIINSTNNVNNVKPFKLKIKENTCIGIGGISGSGKTTFAKDILPSILKNYIYISQKPIKGNDYSIVSSYIEIFDDIKVLFSKRNKVDSSNFSFYHNSLGSCSYCNGKGRIEMKVRYEENIKYKCPECEGSRFNKKSLSHLVNSKNIFEVLNQEVNEAISFFENIEEKSNLVHKLKHAQMLGLSHLRLNQEVQTLSGGESQRIKFLKILKKDMKDLVISLDEPFLGLNNTEIYKIFNLIYTLTKQNTFFIIEHNVFALNLCSYLLEFGPDSGNKGGEIIYFGKKDKINKSSTSKLKFFVQ